MSVDSAVSGKSQSTIFHNKQITEIVVDPDRAHLGESFTISLDRLSGKTSGPDKKGNNVVNREEIASNLFKLASSEDLPRDVIKVGRAIPNINEINHAHPAAVLPKAAVTSPQTKVYFDMPGCGSISFKYHEVKVVSNYLIFVTDKRFGGSAEFYPYCNMRPNEERKPVGVYVQGTKSLFLLDPSVKNFPIKFECDPFEICVVPVGSSKNLTSEMAKELGIVDIATGELENGKESGDREGDNSPEFSGGDSGEPDYESVEGGFGGVL